MNPFFRGLAGLLALVAVVAAALFHLGGKQIEYVAEIQIDSSTEKVMEHLTNPELAAKWAVGFEDMEKRTDEKGNVSEAEISVKLDGEDPETVDQLVTMVADSDTSLSVNHESREFCSVSAWQIVPEGDGVRLRQLLLAKHKGMDRMTALFNRRVVQQQLQQDLTRLKSLVETGKVPPLPSEKTEPITTESTGTESDPAEDNTDGEGEDQEPVENESDEKDSDEDKNSEGKESDDEKSNDMKPDDKKTNGKSA